MNDSIIRSQRVVLQGLINEANSIGVLVTENHNLDKMAAGLALFLSLQAAGKNVSIVSKKDPVVEISNLVGIDQVKNMFTGDAKKLVVSLPYREGEIEKVSYNIEGSRLNINLFAAKNATISFNEKDVEYIKSGAQPSLIFAVGVKNAQELSGFTGEANNVKVVVIDGAQSQNFGDVVIADASFSSVSEIVSVILKEVNLPLDVDIAQNLMDGIVSVTNNFTSGNASFWAFEAAGFLLKNGARRRGRVQKMQQQGASLQQLPNLKSERTAQPQQVQGNGVQERTDGDEQPQQNRQDVKQDSVPSDWFVPKVFKSSRNQGE